MQTTYRIHPNVTWHDGASLTSQDFVFAWTVVMDPELPIESRLAAREIDRIDTPDDHTIVIEWKSLYAPAHAIIEDDVGPFPPHLLKSTYETNKEQFWNLPWWTREFIGVGPYGVVDWVLGTHILLEAYHGFYAGRAKIDRITIRIITDVNTVMAHMLAGTIDWANASQVEFPHALQLKRVGARRAKPTFLARTGTGRSTWVQHRDPGVRELLDVRVRRGLLQALDRKVPVDALVEGEIGVVMDSVVPPDDVRWEWVRDAVTPYPHDPRRAEASLAEAGLRRGPDGVWANAAGGRMVLPHWDRPGYRQCARARHHGRPVEELRGSDGADLHEPGSGRQPAAPSLVPRSAGSNWPNPATVGSLQRLGSAQCATEQNNWTGQNYGCYSSPALDEIIPRLRSAIDPEDQRRPYQQMAAVYSRELPTLPLYFGISATIVRGGITGVTGGADVGGGPTWNIAQWDIE